MSIDNIHFDPSKVNWNEDNLVPAVAQNVWDNNVLMVAWMNEEALQETIQTGLMHYWSRSRNKLWKKGETSGNLQELKGLYLDCDGDTILARVKQIGVACHTGRYTCFTDSSFSQGIFEALQEVFKRRSKNPQEGSYTNRLLANGDLLRKKICEEATEVILAKNKDDLIYESADLIYHLMVLLFSQDLHIEAALDELKRRREES